MDITLTPNQDKTFHNLATFSRSFPMIIIQGERETGKNIIVEKFLSHHCNNGDDIIHLDLCQISLLGDQQLHPCNFYQHLVKTLPNQDRSNSSTKKSRWIYIRHWDKFKDVMEDYGIEHRYFPRYALARFGEKLQLGNCQVIITTEAELRLDTSLYWTIKHETTLEDITFLLKSHLNHEEIEHLLPNIRKTKPGCLQRILAYAEAASQGISRKVFLDKIDEGSVIINGSSLDPEETVTETIPEVNLIGMEKILQAIEVSIINPIEFGSDGIPLKKGIVLVGPPGTGKTSIGRWLTYRLRGKLYLVDGSSGVSGDSLINIMTETIEKAYRNAPAIVFIDDVDTLFDHDDTYRSFLTLLDGLENKHRGNVCIIVTCMNIEKIPSSLVRGGRLELCLETSLPNQETREKILRLGFDKMTRLLQRLEEEKRILPVINKLTNEIHGNNKFIPNVANQMVSWNCADVQRYLDDVLRSILSQQDNFSLRIITDDIVGMIRRQYQLIRRPEERVDYASIYN